MTHISELVNFNFNAIEGRELACGIFSLYLRLLNRLYSSGLQQYQGKIGVHENTSFAVSLAYRQTHIHGITLERVQRKNSVQPLRQ